LSASDPDVQEIGQCYATDRIVRQLPFRRAASKAGQQINLHVGAEGRGYTDENGNFFTRRRTQSILTKLRTAPIFPGDTLVDALRR